MYSTATAPCVWLLNAGKNSTFRDDRGRFIDRAFHFRDTFLGCGVAGSFGVVGVLAFPALDVVSLDAKYYVGVCEVEKTL